jgi:hypothetical protein
MPLLAYCAGLQRRTRRFECVDGRFEPVGEVHVEHPESGMDAGANEKTKEKG